MSISLADLVAQIHSSPTRVALACSGGGAGAVAALVETPGASRVLLEALIPYCEAALVRLLGGRPDQFCSQRTARAMAMATFRRGLLFEPNEAVAGVACTSALATDRPKAGPHRTHLALQSAERTVCWSLELNKGARTRGDEEALVNRLFLNAIADACQAEGRLDLELFDGESVEVQQAAAPREWQALLLGKSDAVRTMAGESRPRGETPRAVFPGEFNPLHSGHRRMDEIAAQLLRAPVEYEIAITNVDKPPLDYLEMQTRAAQFGPQQSLWFTRAARFTDKSQLFPGATFVVGVDTLRRIGSPRYYNDDQAACYAALRQIAGRGCRFLVFGRNLGTGFVGLRDLDLPDVLAGLCHEVPADQFREDVSSTAIRRGSLD